MNCLFSILAFICISPMAFSNEITKGDHEVVSIDGKTFDLDQMLEDDKAILLFFSSTWCSASWEVVERGVLDSIYLAYSNPGSNRLELLFIEADPRTSLEHLQGNVPDTDTIGTLGNWVTDHQYPIFNEESLALEYKISAFPTTILLKKNLDPAILGGSNLTVENIGNWLEEPAFFALNSFGESPACKNRGFAGFAEGVVNVGEEKDFESVREALESHYEQILGFSKWKKEEKFYGTEYSDCKTYPCISVVIDIVSLRPVIYSFNIHRILEGGKRPKKVSQDIWITRSKDTNLVEGITIYIDSYRVNNSGDDMTVRSKFACEDLSNTIEYTANKNQIYKDAVADTIDLCNHPYFQRFLE